MGVLSNGLAPLTVSANRIVSTATGAPVLLRGVNRSGMEYSEPDEEGFASAAGISRHEVRWICREWKANILRIPLNQDWALNGRAGRPAEDYLRDIDRIILLASTYGAYTLLDLQWLDAETAFGSGRQFVSPLPNHSSPAFWTLLARRYRDEPAVLFDILNEPHDRLPNDPHPLPHHGGGFYPASQRRVSPLEWQPWARKLIAAIRAEHPAALVWVSGVNWGYDLRGVPMDDVPNLVYSTHVYRNKGETRAEWAEAFGRLALGRPVFAAEWGGPDADLDWGRRLASYLQDLGMGWCAWSWADKPHLVTRYAPTRFGDLVRSRVG